MRESIHLGKHGHATVIQPSLNINKEDDEYEKEANHVADKVMKMSDPDEGKKMREEGQAFRMPEEPETIQKMSDSSSGLEASPNVEKGISSSKGNGQSLAADTQHELEEKIGADFSDVNIHTDHNAVQMNKEIGAKAFTHGNDIYFNQGQYNPASDQGKHLIAHELTHVVQQGTGLMRKIQRYGDPKSNIPNEGVPGTRGSLDYLPERVDLVNHLNTSSPTPADRKKFITDFLNTFYNYYLKLLATGNWDKAKSIATKATDPLFTAEQQTAPMMDRGSMRSSHWSDFGKRMSMGTNEANAISIIEARPLDNAEKLLYPTLQTMTKGDQATYDSLLDTAALTAETTADLVIQMRTVSNVVSRLYAALTVSETTGMDFGMVTALYGQEGNFDMPSSADSLSMNIPTGETAGVTSLNAGGNYLDFKGMVLTIPTDSALMTSRPTEAKRKLFAVAQYFNQIGGLDVVNKQLPLGIDGLAAWSMENRNYLNTQGGLSPALQSDTLASMKTYWQKQVDNIKETTESFKTSITEPSPGTPKDTVYRFAPIDPVFLVQSVLTEAALYHKTKDYFPEKMMGAAGAGMELSPGVSYMMYNLGANRKNQWDKKIFSSSIRAGKTLSATKIKEITDVQTTKKAEDVTFADLQTKNPDMAEKMLYDLLELVTFPSGVISTEPTDSQFDTYVQPWMLDVSRVAPYTRFDLTQYFMEHAGTDVWTGWAQTRRNSSNFRTLMEFYQNVFR